MRRSGDVHRWDWKSDLLQETRARGGVARPIQGVSGCGMMWIVGIPNSSIRSAPRRTTLLVDGPFQPSHPNHDSHVISKSVSLGLEAWNLDGHGLGLGELHGKKTVHGWSVSGAVWSGGDFWPPSRCRCGRYEHRTTPNRDRPFARSFCLKGDQYMSMTKGLCVNRYIYIY